MKILNKEIETIDICVNDKAEQIYDMSKQIEKLLDENTLLKKEIEEMKQSNDESERYREKQGFSI